ncbi:MAG: hypothetical protein IJM30_12370 [Thermoguttaceae bacterium]|nr:hypothetical protein [Thermoguttaceae bacterium]
MSDAIFRPNFVTRARVFALALLALLVCDTLAGQVPSSRNAVVGSALRFETTFQPVEWKLPQGAIAEIARPGAYVSDETNPNLFGVVPRATYRFKISGFNSNPNAVVYPTLELLGPLGSPADKAWDFPVELYLPMEDVELALGGSMVTRVVYVENNANPANVDATEFPDRMTLNVPRGVDPIVAANTRGRAIAIIRVGSREPNGAPDPADPFFFGTPKFVFKPSVSEPVQTGVALQAPRPANNSIARATSNASAPIVSNPAPIAPRARRVANPEPDGVGRAVSGPKETAKLAPQPVVLSVQPVRQNVDVVGWAVSGTRDN